MTNSIRSKHLPGKRNGKTRWPLIALTLFLGIGLIAFFEIKSHGVSRLATRLLGPPQVELQESFAEKPDGTAFDHSAFDELLKENVDDDGWVDYQHLRTQEDRLDNYIAALGSANIDELGRDERLAFLINSYNAFNLKLVVEYYPLASIKDIPDAQRWDAVRWNLAGQKVSLNQIEHELVRPNFKEPRIHFSLVCAAVGCPPLRNDAFTGQKLEQQLASQSAYVHSHATWFDYNPDDNVLKLTQLYNWYGDDFVQVAGSVENFASTQSPTLKRALEKGTELNVQWLDYDWTLNDKSRRSPR
jgi:hypothetical protein